MYSTASEEYMPQPGGSFAIHAGFEELATDIELEGKNMRTFFQSVDWAPGTALGTGILALSMSTSN